MYRKFGFLVFSFWLFFLACSSDEPTGPGNTDIHPTFTSMVAIGNSLTAGVQSGGILNEFQLNSYPYLVALQAGAAGSFQQPLVAPPGVGEIDSLNGTAYGPLKYEGGQIVQGDPVPGGLGGIQALLTNSLLPRAYNNLGLPGATLSDILNATGGGIYDAVLRNPFFGNTTALQQARSLNPTLLLPWAGNNDVLGAALDGGELSQITNLTDFEAQYNQLFTELNDMGNENTLLIIANIPNVTDIPYVNLLDDKIYKDFTLPGPITLTLPVLFDETFTAIDFDTGAAELYIPLLTSENVLTVGSPVTHVLLPFLSEYQDNGLGVPDSAALVPLLIASGQPLDSAQVNAGLLQQAMQAGGLITSGDTIPGNLTLTQLEEDAIAQAVSSFNQVIEGIAVSITPNIPVIDMNSLLSTLNSSGYEGYSGQFVFFDPQNTAFSLDGVHPNNGGYAMIANEFIKELNNFPDITLPLLNLDDFKGQYSSIPPTGITARAARQAKAYFVD